MSWGARLAVVVVRGYQLVLRPLLPAACRFEPSCSEYARDVLAEHGLTRGTWLAMRRVGRCHPFHAGGYDPPPLARPRPREEPRD
jgi:putative membrane protein insertion efficiency factor